jgi:hypothetical protein
MTHNELLRAAINEFLKANGGNLLAEGRGSETGGYRRLAVASQRASKSNTSASFHLWG